MALFSVRCCPITNTTWVLWKGAFHICAKYEQLAATLRSEVRQILRQGGSKLPSEAEIAGRYHMSRQTVRHALKLLEEEGIIRRRQGSGSYIQNQELSDDPRQIAVITTFPDDYIFPTILHDTQNSFSQAGYSTLVFATENKVTREWEILTRLLEQNISAVLVEGSRTALPTPNSDLYQQLHDRGTPNLFLHGVYSNLSGFPCLMDDNFSGGYQLAQYVLSKGHRRIAGIFKSDDIQGPQRYHGVVSALRDNGIAIRDDGFFWYDSEARSVLLRSHGSDVLPEFVEHRLGDATAVGVHRRLFQSRSRYGSRRLWAPAEKSRPFQVLERVCRFVSGTVCQSRCFPLWVNYLAASTIRPEPPRLL